MQHLSVDTAATALQQTPELSKFFGGNSESCFQATLAPRKDSSGNVTLRDAHAAAVVAGLNAAQPGRLNVIALEGNPGIGKTTAVTEFLSQQQEGYCFLYVSPRVVINRDVTNKLAQTFDGDPSGILTITSNAKLISAAPAWHIQEAARLNENLRRVDSAVVVNGVPNLIHPVCKYIFVTPEEEQAIDTDIVTSRRYKRSRNEREDSVQSQIQRGTKNVSNFCQEAAKAKSKR